LFVAIFFAFFFAFFLPIHIGHIPIKFKCPGKKEIYRATVPSGQISQTGRSLRWAYRIVAQVPLRGWARSVARGVAISNRQASTMAWLRVS
jgi:hypothetical protein